MESVETCPECGTVWQNGVTCTDHFHQALFWENEYPQYTLQVHNYLVLCYHLQHPSLYSREMLPEALKLLDDFLGGATTEYVRKRDRDLRDSGKRTWKITGTPESHGEYQHPVRWTMTIADITADSVENYEHNVRLWAQSIYDALRESGNLAAR
jgi:hypothetical protein